MKTFLKSLVVGLSMVVLVGFLAFPAGSTVDVDGTDDFIDLGTATDFNFERTDPFSVSIWIKIDDSGAGQLRGLVSRALTSGNFTGWTLWLRSDNEFHFFFRNDNTPDNEINVSTQATFSSADGWINFVLTYDGSVAASGVTIYKDGSLIPFDTDSDTLNASTLATVNATIGSTNNGGSPFTGEITDVAIWGSELSSLEVSQIYNSSGKRMMLQIDPANIISCWALDDISEGANLDSFVFIDICGGGNDGTGSDSNASGGQGRAESNLTYF